MFLNSLNSLELKCITFMYSLKTAYYMTMQFYAYLS